MQSTMQSTEPTAWLALVRRWLGLLQDPDERLYPGFLASSVLLAYGVYRLGVRRGAVPNSFRQYLFPRSLWWHRSARVDYQLLVVKALFRTLVLVPLVVQAITVAASVAALMQFALGVPTPSTLPEAWIIAAYTLVLFVVDDGTRFLLHAAMHRVRWLWRFHQVHHSAQVLTPFTLHRIHPVEAALYALRSALSTGVVTGIFYYFFRGGLNTWAVLGVNAFGFAFNLAGANLRHSHVWLPYGKTLERWLISPAMHQLHHSVDPRHHDTNLGSFLALWDRWAGSWHGSIKPDTLRFGLGPGSNHRATSVLSCLAAPFLPLGGSVQALPLGGSVQALPLDAQADSGLTQRGKARPEQQVTQAT